MLLHCILLTVCVLQGFTFLCYLQSLVGGAAPMEKFLYAYFDHFANKTVSAAQFRAFFTQYFSSVLPGTAVDWDAWLHTPGLPQWQPQWDLSLVSGAKEQAAKWKAGAYSDAGHGGAPDLSTWTTPQRIIFLEELLQEPLPSLAVMQALDHTYHFSHQRNAEIRSRWLTLLLRTGVEFQSQTLPAVTAFLSEQGRMKYVRPLFRELAKQHAAEARMVFESVRARYHNITAKMVARDLGLE